jgi:hypothetical protein
MNHNQFLEKSYPTTGALEINLRAHEQNKFQHQMQAAWLPETQPVRIQKHNEFQVFLARMQAGLSVLSRWLVSASR